MATLQTRLQDLTTRIATEAKALRTLINGNVSDLSSLKTTAKSSLVAALNELKDAIDDMVENEGAVINDGTTSLTATWSSQKINDAIQGAIDALTNGAPTALDTLAELAAALGEDADFAATVTTALGNRVRTDTDAQGLTSTQKENARKNIDAYGSAELGDPDTNLVDVFNAGLL